MKWPSAKKLRVALLLAAAMFASQLLPAELGDLLLDVAQQALPVP